jgi:glycine/serine hydroxymethyltransferase
MRQLAEWIDRVLSGAGSEDVTGQVRQEVSQLCREFPIPAAKEAEDQAKVRQL